MLAAMLSLDHELGLALLLLCAAGCGGEGEIAWRSLAQGSQPDGGSGAAQQLASGDDVVRRLITSASETRLEVELGASWKPEGGGLWRVQLGFQPLAHLGHELSSRQEPERRFTLAPPLSRARLDTLAEGSFTLARAELWLRLPEGQGPPERALLSCRLDANAPGHPGRLRGRRYSGAGFSVWPGARIERRCALDGGSALRFATALDPLVTGSSALPAVVFRVELDGVVLFEHREPDPSRASAVWHEVVLPAEGRGSATLAFSVEGTPAYTSFLDPVLGPAEVGRTGARPWGTSGPDVVVFLPDTFRADNMQLYRGEPGADVDELELTPNLDRFARESLAFARAWSVGTFTLSAHASMFTGLYPHQAGVLGEEHELPEELETLAELFAARGYRTGAITDSGIVSQVYALDQGFGFFDEKKRPLEDTLAAAEAFLDADDGRPVFLFVHTYRVHRPFEVSEETRREHGARLGLRRTFRALERQLVELARSAGHPRVARVQDFPRELVGTPEAGAILQELRAHYRGGVIDLDRGFERFRADLTARGMLAHGFLVFTSDHGESFGEHGQIYHKDDVYEEQTRVPLLLAGRGIEPAVVSHAASLVDLAPTLAALAGLERAGGPQPWLGRSLLGLDEERVLYSFECSRDARGSTFAVMEGTRKVIGLEDAQALRAGHVVAAFDLAGDPHELANVAPAEAWPAEQLARFRPAVEHLLVPLVGRRSAQLDPEKRSELDALGYGGDGD